jgi:hypothetical protein
MWQALEEMDARLQELKQLHAASHDTLDADEKHS